MIGGMGMMEHMCGVCVVVDECICVFVLMCVMLCVL